MNETILNGLDNLYTTAIIMIGLFTAACMVVVILILISALKKILPKRPNKWSEEERAWIYDKNEAKELRKKYMLKKQRQRQNEFHITENGLRPGYEHSHYIHCRRLERISPFAIKADNVTITFMGHIIQIEQRVSDKAWNIIFQEKRSEYEDS